MGGVHMLGTVWMCVAMGMYVGYGGYWYMGVIPKWNYGFSRGKRVGRVTGMSRSEELGEKKYPEEKLKWRVQESWVGRPSQELGSSGYSHLLERLSQGSTRATTGSVACSHALNNKDGAYDDAHQAYGQAQGTDHSLCCLWQWGPYFWFPMFDSRLFQSPVLDLAVIVIGGRGDESEVVEFSEGVVRTGEEDSLKHTVSDGTPIMKPCHSKHGRRELVNKADKDVGLAQLHWALGKHCHFRGYVGVRGVVGPFHHGFQVGFVHSKVGQSTLSLKTGKFAEVRKPPDCLFALQIHMENLISIKVKHELSQGVVGLVELCLDDHMLLFNSSGTPGTQQHCQDEDS